MRTIKLRNLATFGLLMLALVGLASCEDGPVFEKEGDCSAKVQFVFKKHRHALYSLPGKETDAFYSAVESVHLFIYDAQTGELVFEKTEKTDNLKSAVDLKLGTQSEKCYLPVDLKAGKYRLVAWCGLDENDSNNAFRLVEDGVGTKGGYAHCEVRRPDGEPYKAEKYQNLYHGRVEEVTVDNRGNQVIPIELTKNNNDIAVWVQHTTQTFSDGDYEVVYTDANGTMHFHDNSMTDASRLQYRPHATSLLTASTEFNGSVMETGALVAHISTARLMEAHRNDARLEVRDREGRTVFSIPFIDYVLRLQTLTGDGQRYLDCEDTYNCSFYLSGDTQINGQWMPAMIIINNWVVVPDQSGIL